MGNRLPLIAKTIICVSVITATKNSVMRGLGMKTRSFSFG